MKNKICYKAQRGLDDVIASHVEDWTVTEVTNLRGMWEEQHPDRSITVDDAQLLIDYKKNLSEEDSKRLANAMRGTHKATDAVVYNQLRNAFSAEERFDRVTMISTIFSSVIDAIQEANPNMSRKEVLEKGGVSNVFASVYESLQEQYSIAVEEGNREVADKYQKIFDNWDALVYASKARIKLTEDLKLGQDIDFVDEANPDNFNDNNMANKFVMEESKREGWMEQSEFQAAFGSIGQQVRKVIGRLPQFDKDGVKLDDLGFPKMQDPVRVHQELLDVLRGMSTESQMIEMLRQYSSTSAWIGPLLEELDNPEIRTQFFVDFKKNFQPYSMQTEEAQGRIRKYKTVILNKIKGDKPFSSYLSSVKLGKIINPAKVIFENTENGTRVMPVRLERVRSKIIENLHQEGPLATPKFWKLSRIDKKEFLIDVTESLNMDVNGETIDRILARPKDLRKFLKNLYDTATFGLNLTKEEQSGNKTISYEDLIKKASSNEAKGVLREKLTKMLAITTKNNEGLKVDSRVRFNGNTMYSNVIPSFMGDRMDMFGTFAKDANKDGLRGFLESTYLNSSYFMHNGRILNKWIEELYNSDLTKEDNFCANFQYKRGLALDELNFEDFTPKQHLLYLMNEYFSEGQISSKSEYAWYPVFILGDSGVAKFIKAKRYGYEEIVDGLYNTYVQERRRMELAKAVDSKLQKEGYKAIDNFSPNKDKFSLLPFLNEERFASMINENNLEESVKSAINAYLREGINTFKEKVDRLGLLEKTGSEYNYLSQEVKGDRTVDKVLADYYCNTKFATIQQLQMMTIDPSFYSGTKDLQKRYKEIHAPGSALSIEAIDPWTGRRYSDGIERVVYFNDISLNAEDVDSEFMRVIANQFGEDSDVYKAYLENTLTDGQGYRTLESYRKVMGMAGKWTANMQNAYEAIKAIRARIGTGPISPEDIKALSDLAVVFQPLKPYMYTFENYSINGTDMLKIPVQHKYAEAVLIPELLPAGSKLRDMAYWMDENNIDMVCSTKAVKVGAFGSTNITNTNDKASLNNALSQAYVHQLSYADYRLQSNVPEHTNSSQLFGTQVRKLIMAGIKAAKDYSKYVKGKEVNLGNKQGKVNLNGYNLVRFYNSLIVANILESYDKFADAISTTEKVSSRLIQSSANNDRESKDNILSYIVNEFGEMAVPLFEGALEHDSSALMQSLFKKMVNKQSIKGGSAVQVSSMGITGYEEDGGLKYVTDGDNNILHAECEMPWDLNYTDALGNVHALDFNDWCTPDGNLKLDKDGKPLIEKSYPNILSMVAYRIPTERDYSMINLRIKRFSQKTAGGTIKVPVQGTTIAGFDFDIDKLYLMLNEFKYKELGEKEVEKAWKDFYKSNPELYKELLDLREADKSASSLIESLLGVESGLSRLYEYKEGTQKLFSEWLSTRGNQYSPLDTYDFDKSPLENSRAARNNMLINLIQQRLQDEETFKSRYTPGGFANASKAAKKLRFLVFGSETTDKFVDSSNQRYDIDKLDEVMGKLQDPEPNYDPSDPMTIITYNQQNQVAGKLIGIFANQNTNHAFASLMQVFALKKPISFAGKSFRDFLNPPEGTDPSLSIAELLAASVDAVKDPVLNFLNLNTITADAGSMLARLGYSMEDIGLLFNQPIIKDICEYSFNNGMSDISSVIQNVLDDQYELKGEESKAISSIEFSKEALAYNIVEARQKKFSDMSDSEYEEFKQKQRHIATLFKEIIEASNDVGEFVRNTKFTASNAVGSTLGDAIAQQMKVSKYVQSFEGNSKLKVDIVVSQEVYTPISDDAKLLDMSKEEYLDYSLINPFAYEQAMFDMNRKAYKAMNKYYPYDTHNYKAARSTLARLTKSGILDAETINSIHSDMMVFLLASQEGSEFDGNTTVHTPHGKVSTREFYTTMYAELVSEILEENPTLKELPIFKFMQFQTDEKTGVVSMNVQEVGGLAPYQRDEIKESWAELAKNADTYRLAQGLFMYNYYKLGFVFSPQSFMNLAPTELKQRIQVGTDYNGNPRSYVDFLNDVSKGDKLGFNVEEFTKQYLLNHLDNPRLAFTPKGKSAKIVNSLAYSGDVVNSSFVLDAKKWGKDANPFIIEASSSGVTSFRPVIVIGDDVFMCDNGLGSINISEDGAIRYYHVNKLGSKGKSLQYNLSMGDSIADRTISSTKEEGNTSIEPEVSTNIVEVSGVESLVKEALELYQKIEPDADMNMAITILKEAAAENLNEFKAFIEELKTKVNQLRSADGKPLC